MSEALIEAYREMKSDIASLVVMTVTMNLDEFLNTLNHLIESANGCLQDPKSFLAVNAEIGELIEAVSRH